MTLAEAEALAKRTDYACEATHQDENPINWADAGAFFLAGYEYAMKEIGKPATAGREEHITPSEAEALANRTCCSVCVNWYDVTPSVGSMVRCAPQKLARDWDHKCTGFRRIPLTEIEERTASRFGIKVPPGQPGREERGRE